MKKKNYKHPEMSEIALTPNEDILTGSGYTGYSLFDGIGNISDDDTVYWGS